MIGNFRQRLMFKAIQALAKDKKFMYYTYFLLLRLVSIGKPSGFTLSKAFGLNFIKRMKSETLVLSKAVYNRKLTKRLVTVEINMPLDNFANFTYTGFYNYIQDELLRITGRIFTHEVFYTNDHHSISPVPSEGFNIYGAHIPTALFNKLNQVKQYGQKVAFMNKTMAKQITERESNKDYIYTSENILVNINGTPVRIDEVFPDDWFVITDLTNYQFVIGEDIQLVKAETKHSENTLCLSVIVRLGGRPNRNQPMSFMVQNNIVPSF